MRNINRLCLSRLRRLDPKSVGLRAKKFQKEHKAVIMKPKFPRFIHLSFLLALTVAMIPVTVHAQLGITSVLPNQVINDVSTSITITGTDFVAESVVLLDGYGALSTSFQNSSVLTATVPAGIPAGTYTLTVSIGAESVSCANCLTVLAPTPIPPTPVPTATTAPLPFTRPQFVVRSSKVIGGVQTSKDFNLKVVLENAGTATAYSTQAVFSSADLVPLKNGGVAVLGGVNADDEIESSQAFYVTAQLAGKTIIVVDLTITYYDDQGTSYSDKFTLSLPVSGGTASSGAVYPTATPTGVKSSQLVITSYQASVDPLQPGEQFALAMTVQNMGNVRAQRVTMIVGGGSSGTSGGTPQPGGVSGGSGEFTNFAPVGASNVQSLGDLAAGDTIQASQNLIVNVSTNPGAYPMKVTFSYLNDKAEVINDEQVITLLVYSLPNVDVSFYRPPDPFFVGQPGALPIQVVNLGKRLAVLGNMKITAGNGTIENGTSLVGSLDAGGYFTLDSLLTPEQSGTLTLTIVIDYTDDFNQPRTLTRTIDVDVMEGAPEEPGGPAIDEGGAGPVVSEESVWQKIWRFVLGLFGLDSSAPTNGNPGGGEPQFEQPVPAQPGTGKG
jgi:hypothetical protein